MKDHKFWPIKIHWGGGGERENKKLKALHAVQRAASIPLYSVITNISKLNFHIFICHGQTDLHADGGLFPHPKTQTGFIFATWDFNS